MEKDLKKRGLVWKARDPRNYSLGGVHDLPGILELPREYEVQGAKYIKDQGHTDVCTAEAGSAVSEDEEETELFPFFTFAMTRKIMNAKITDYGADLESACKAGVQYGFLSAGDAQRIYDDTLHNLYEQGGPMADTAKSLAIAHKKASYFEVDGEHDIFDNIRVALWHFKDEKRSVFTGIEWREAWDNGFTLIPGLVNSVPDGGEKYGHAIKIFGWVEAWWKEDYGTPFLKAQLSNGNEIGDKGFFYLSREVVNSQCTYGAFTFSDMTKERVQYKLGRISLLSYLLKLLLK